MDGLVRGKSLRLWAPFDQSKERVRYLISAPLFGPMFYSAQGPRGRSGWNNSIFTGQITRKTRLQLKGNTLSSSSMEPGGATSATYWLNCVASRCSSHCMWFQQRDFFNSFFVGKSCFTSFHHNAYYCYYQLFFPSHFDSACVSAARLHNSSPIVSFLLNKHNRTDCWLAVFFSLPEFLCL